MREAASETKRLGQRFDPKINTCNTLKTYTISGDKRGKWEGVAAVTRQASGARVKGSIHTRNAFFTPLTLSLSLATATNTIQGKSH